MSAPTVIRNLLSDSAFESIQHWVVNSARHSGAWDEEYQRTTMHEARTLFDVHSGLTQFASEVFGVALKPSYVFMSNYIDGGRCPLHVDRPQCFRTIDYLVAADDPEPWPIRIAEPWTDQQFEGYEGPLSIGLIEPDTEPDLDVTWHEVLLNPNDAACYSGTHSWHYRPTPSKGRADLIFFHFVPEDFDGPLG
jgi:hypothetical protein